MTLDDCKLITYKCHNHTHVFVFGIPKHTNVFRTQAYRELRGWFDSVQMREQRHCKCLSQTDYFIENVRFNPFDVPLEESFDMDYFSVHMKNKNSAALFRLNF